MCFRITLFGSYPIIENAPSTFGSTVVTTTMYVMFGQKISEEFKVKSKIVIVILSHLIHPWIVWIKSIFIDIPICVDFTAAPKSVIAIFDYIHLYRFIIIL